MKRTSILSPAQQENSDDSPDEFTNFAEEYKTKQMQMLGEL